MGNNGKREMGLQKLMFLIFVFFISSCQNNGQVDLKKMEKKFMTLREKMVLEQIERRGIKDKNVLEAMKKVPRHLFVPEEYINEAYEDYPLPIGEGQTISQPYIVAKMTELLEIKKGEKVLEIGTGSGYQAAVLAEVGAKVYTIEILPKLAEKAKKTLSSLGYENVTVLVGDGFKGYIQEAPYDKIIVTAAPEKIPQPLIEQLKVGGKLVIPVGKYDQELKVVTKKEEGIIVESVLPVRFVPMVGEVEK
jgi:protein-L-isoaspartate(D-aspartate) O-methyltransferase